MRGVNNRVHSSTHQASTLRQAAANKAMRMKIHGIRMCQGDDAVAGATHWTKVKPLKTLYTICEPCRHEERKIPHSALTESLGPH